MDIINLDMACYIPFNRFVNEALPPDPNKSFTKFPALPVELQARIIQVCDARTLFQLMRTTSFTRAEASRVFFSQPDTYYHFPVEMIYSRPASDWPSEGQLATELEFDIDFLRRVENVALTGDFFFVIPPIPAFREVMPDKTDENVMMFWERFRAVLPSVNRLIIQDNRHSKAVAKNLKLSLPKLFRACPLEITCSFWAFESHANQFLASVYQLKPHTECEDSSPWESLPPKPFYLVQPPRPVISGVIGQFQTLHWAQADLHQEWSIFVWLEKVAADPPRRPSASKANFSCQTKGCEFEFKFGQPMAHQCSEWTQARGDKEAQRKANEPQKFMEKCASFIASEYGSPLIEKRERFSRATSAHESRMRLWKEAVGKEKSETRAEYRTAFLAQLGSDPLFREQGDPSSSLLFMKVRKFLWHEADGNRGNWVFEGETDDEL